MGVTYFTLIFRSSSFNRSIPFVRLKLAFLFSSLFSSSSGLINYFPRNFLGTVRFQQLTYHIPFLHVNLTPTFRLTYRHAMVKEPPVTDVVHVARIVHFNRHRSRSVRRRLPFRNSTRNDDGTQVSRVYHGQHSISRTLLRYAVNLQGSFSYHYRVTRRTVIHFARDRYISAIEWVVGRTVNRTKGNLHGVNVTISHTIVRFRVFRGLAPDRCNLHKDIAGRYGRSYTTVTVFSTQGALGRIIFDAVSDAIFDNVSIDLSDAVFCKVPHVLYARCRTERNRTQVISVPGVTPVNSRRTFHATIGTMTYSTHSIIPHVISTQRRHVPPPCNQTCSLFNSNFHRGLSFLVNYFQVMLPIRRNSIIQRDFRGFQRFNNSISPRRKLITLLKRIFTRFTRMYYMRHYSTRALHFLLQLTFTRIRNFIYTSVGSFHTRRLRMQISRLHKRHRHSVINSIRYIIPRTFSRTRQPISIFKRFTRFTRFLHTRHGMLVTRYKS